MNTILIATDFSKASRNAYLYGIHLAKALNAEVILFNAFLIPAPPAEFNINIYPDEIITDINKRLLSEADFLDPKRELIETICEEGEAADMILKIANAKKVSFIINGMKGSIGNFRKIFGSTVTELIRKSNIPIFIIPDSAEYCIPKTLLYASDVTLDTNIMPIDQIKQFTDFFKPKLYVVTVVQDHYDKVFEGIISPKKLRHELQILNTTFEFPVNLDITSSLNKFVVQNQVDIVIMMPHKHAWIERIFRKGQTKDMVFHSHIPMIILPALSTLPTNQKLPSKKYLQYIYI